MRSRMKTAWEWCRGASQDRHLPPLQGLPDRVALSVPYNSSSGRDRALWEDVAHLPRPPPQGLAVEDIIAGYTDARHASRVSRSSRG